MTPDELLVFGMKMKSQTATKPSVCRLVWFEKFTLNDALNTLRIFLAGFELYRLLTI